MNLPTSVVKAIHEANAMASSESEPMISLRHMIMGLFAADLDLRIAYEEHEVDCDDILHAVHFDDAAPLICEEPPSRVLVADRTFRISDKLGQIFDKAAGRVSVYRPGDVVTGIDFMVAALDDQEHPFIQWLTQETNVVVEDLLAWLERDRRRKTAIAVLDARKTQREQAQGAAALVQREMDRFAKGQEQQTQHLDRFCTNLNKKAMRKHSGFVGRDGEIKRVMRVLARQSKCNPVLIGDPGVGKTAVVEGLAQLLVKGDVPLPLLDATIYSLDLGALVSGTRYRGDFEGRVSELIKELHAQKNAILFIDEIHMLIGAGASNSDPMDASNLLKPLLQEGTLRCIGATTYREYRKYIEQDPALARRFQAVVIDEPGVDDAIEIARGVQGRFESHHGVVFADEAVEAAVNLSVRYIHDRKLPDKAIDLLDEAAAAVRIENPSAIPPRIDRRHIEEVVASVAGVPVETISRDPSDRLRDMEASLRSAVFGQDEAIREVVDAVKLARAGLGNPEKPIGCFLFTGPTGVGKTETARQLADLLGTKLIRFDMSEYNEPHSISRLIGSPPGYVGYQEEGLLTGAVSKAPYSVLLLDEIEKGHPQVWSLLLQVMDYGKLTDATGKIVDFRNCMIIMTSNVGAVAMSRPAVGFVRDNDQDAGAQEIQDVFAPEFRNRLDRVIRFSQLGRDTTLRVVEKLLRQLSAKLTDKNVHLTYSEDVPSWFLSQDYDDAMGARPLERLVKTHVARPLADELLFGELAEGGDVRLFVSAEGLKISLGRLTGSTMASRAEAVEA